MSPARGQRARICSLDTPAPALISARVFAGFHHLLLTLYSPCHSPYFCEGAKNGILQSVLIGWRGRRGDDSLDGP